TAPTGAGSGGAHGDDQPVVAGAVAAARGSTSPRALLGRDAEQEQLLRALDEAASGRTTITLLMGEGGIGKTTLAGAAERAARGRGFRIAWGRCWETGDAPPLWPWSQALRGLGARRSLEAL